MWQQVLGNTFFTFAVTGASHAGLRSLEPVVTPFAFDCRSPVSSLRIIDLWGMGFGHLRFAKDFLAVAVQQTVALYPETLDRVLVVNAETCQRH